MPFKVHLVSKLLHPLELVHWLYRSNSLILLTTQLQRRQQKNLKARITWRWPKMVYLEKGLFRKVFCHFLSPESLHKVDNFWGEGKEEESITVFLYYSESKLSQKHFKKINLKAGICDYTFCWGKKQKILFPVRVSKRKFLSVRSVQPCIWILKLKGDK